MLDRAIHFLRPRRPGVRLYWLTSDIAIGSVSSASDWPDVYQSGVRAVVDVRGEPEDVGSEVRKHGMRYLRLCIKDAHVPSAEELHIVSSWVLDRTSENGRVLIQDSRSSFNDGLVAVASLIKGGLPAHLALLALRRVMPGNALDSRQNVELVRFAAGQSPV